MFSKAKKLVKRILSQKNTVRLGKLKRVVEKKLLLRISKYRLASRLYYIFASSAFAREQQGVLYGRHQYLKGLDEPAKDRFSLRRNIHRLEKGLLMRPRREVFATSYIEGTVETYLRSVRQATGVLREPELRWAREVLSKYFSIAGSHATIDRARRKFQVARERRGGSVEPVPLSPADDEEDPPMRGGGASIPYHRAANGTSFVSYKSFLKLSHWRRSVRWYLPKRVPRALIDKAVEAAAQSPSACNRQPFHFRIFDDTDRVQEVLDLPIGAKGYSHNVPVVIVVVGRQRAYFDERDRHVIYIDGALAAMSLMFALETLGLSSCPINWPDIEEREKRMSEMLDLDLDERPIMLLSVGYPDPEGQVAFSQKKPLDRIRKYN